MTQHTILKFPTKRNSTGPHSPESSRKSKRGYHDDNQTAQESSTSQVLVQSPVYSLSDPHTKVFDFIVIGGGTSAGYVAKAFVANGVNNNSVCVLSREAVPPYERTDLSKGYLFKWRGFEDMLACKGMGSGAQSATWYLGNGIDLVLSTEVQRLDCLSRTILADNGMTYIAKKAVVLATGSRPRKISLVDENDTPVQRLKNVFSLTTKADADEIVTSLAPLRVQKKRPVCLVLGSGFLGMEIAASMCEMGLETTLVSRPKHLNPAIFSQDIAAYYEKVFESHGVKILFGNPVQKIVGQNGEISHVILQDGTAMYCDCAIVSVGNEPNTELVKGQVCMRNGAVKVDGSLMSSVPGIYAVGDICQLPLGMYGNSTSGGNPLMHGEHARRSGSHVVKSLLRKGPEMKRVYEYHPFLYSSFFNCNWKFWGDTVGQEVRVARPGDSAFMVVWMWEHRVQGIFVESLPRSAQLMMEAASRLQCLLPESELAACATVQDAVNLIAQHVDLSKIRGLEEFGDTI